MPKPRTEKATKAKSPKAKKDKAAPPAENETATPAPAAEQQPQAEASTDQTQVTEPVAATGTQSWTLTADQSRAYRADLLQTVARGQNGILALSDLAAWGAQQDNGWHPEVLEMAAGEELVLVLEDQVALTGAGFQVVLRIREEKAAERAARQQDIIDAHTEYAKGEQVLLLRRKGAEEAIEQVRGILNAKKLALAEVEKEIAAYLTQGPQIKASTGAKQQSLLDLPGVLPKPSPSGIAADWRKVLPGVENDRVILVDARKGEIDLPALEDVVKAIISPLVFEGDKRVLGEGMVVEVAGHKNIVTACWKDDATHEGRANVVRLYPMAEWYDLHVNNLGPAVNGHDATDEGREKRQREGAWCGLVVHVNNEPLVVGPQSHAQHLVYTGPAAAAVQEGDVVPEVAHDSKAMAAGEGREPEDIVLTGLDEPAPAVDNGVDPEPSEAGSESDDEDDG